MDLILLAIRQPVTVTVGVHLIILAGVISLTRLPIQLTPTDSIGDRSSAVKMVATPARASQAIVIMA